MTNIHLKKLDSLLLILRKIANEEMPTSESLAEELNISAKTIQRTIYNELKYFPIDRNKNGNLFLKKGFILSEALLSNNELLINYIALKYFDHINIQTTKNINISIYNLFYKDLNSILFFKKDYPNNDNIMNMLDKAVEERIVCKIYINEVEYLINPITIVDCEDLFFLISFNKKNQEINSALIDTIDKVVFTSKNFKSTEDEINKFQNIHPLMFKQIFKYEVFLEIEKAFLDNLESRKILPNFSMVRALTKEKYLISFKSNFKNEIFTLLRSHIPHFKIFGPEDIKTEFKIELENYIKYI